MEQGLPKKIIGKKFTINASKRRHMGGNGSGPGDVGDVDSAADDLVAPCHGSAAVDPSLDGVARGRRMAPTLAFFCSS